MSLLELDHVTRKYQRGGWFGKSETVTALSDVSLSLQQGESLGLIGRSGAGKSTLGRLVLGLEHPDKGAVRYLGKDLRSFNKKDWQDFRRGVQVVFQNALGSVNPRWQVLDIIAEPIRNNIHTTKEQVRTMVYELLELVGLHPRDADKYPHQFSGGQLQRICIARALALKPQLIVLDEAVSSLDMLVQAQILQLLRLLQEETRVSYLFVSHDIRIVSGFCSAVAVMHQGHLTSMIHDLSQAEQSQDPTLRLLADSILPAWPQLAN